MALSEPNREGKESEEEKPAGEAPASQPPGEEAIVIVPAGEAAAAPKGEVVAAEVAPEGEVVAEVAEEAPEESAPRGKPLAIVIRATCSECFYMEEMEISSFAKELVCPSCGHTVPALGERDFQNIYDEQSRAAKAGTIAFISFLVTVVFFGLFCILLENARLQENVIVSAGLPAVMFITLALTVWKTYEASSREHICEY